MAERVLAHYLLVVSVQGSEEIVVQGQAFTIPEGGAYLIQPGVLTGKLSSKRGNRPVYLHFDLVFNERRQEHRNTYGHESTLRGREHLLQPTIREVFGVDLPVCVPAKLAHKFAASIEPIVHRWLGGRPLDVLWAHHELESLLLAWLMHAAPRAEGSKLQRDSESRLRRAEVAAQMKLASFGVEEFAQAAGLGRAQFARLYHALRGMSPGKALRDMRLNEAERLLANTELSIHEISHQVGYPNPTVLARSFRERYGMSPSAWREEYAD